MSDRDVMPTVNIRGLRDKQQLKAWLRAGKTLELRERDKVIRLYRSSGTAGKTASNPRFRRHAPGDFWGLRPSGSRLVDQGAAAFPLLNSYA
jgi:hypothetical protein